MAAKSLTWLNERVTKKFPGGSAEFDKELDRLGAKLERRDLKDFAPRLFK